MSVKLKDITRIMNDLQKDFDRSTVGIIHAARLAGIQVVPSSALEDNQVVLLVSPKTLAFILKEDADGKTGGS